MLTYYVILMQYFSTWFKYRRPNKKVLVFKASSTHVVLKISSTLLQRNNFPSSKRSWRHVFRMSWRHVLKTAWWQKNVYLRHLHLANLNVHLINLYFTNIYLTNLRRIQNALIRTQKFRYPSYFEKQAAFLF